MLIILTTFHIFHTRTRVGVKAHSANSVPLSAGTRREGGSSQGAEPPPRSASPGGTGLTFPKSLTSNRSKASNSSLFFMPNASLHAARNVLMFFRHRNCVRGDKRGVHLWEINSTCTENPSFSFPKKKRHRMGSHAAVPPAHSIYITSGSGKYSDHFKMYDQSWLVQPERWPKPY